MARAALLGDAQPMDDCDVIQRIRAAMARHGQPVDDLSDAEIRARAVALTGRRDGLERVARVLEAVDDEGDE
jgi:hypothetical protein